MEQTFQKNVHHVSIDITYKPTINAKKHRNHMNGRIYVIVNYDKKYVCYNDENVRKYRSVVFSFPERKLLCFSPVKSMSDDSFLKKYNNGVKDNLYINEFIEGFMVNLFYDKNMRSWEIATKTHIGGDNSVYCSGYHKKHLKTSVYKLFCKLLGYDDTPNINHAGFLEYFSKEHCYSFVLRSKDINHFEKDTEKQLFLVSVYKIHDNFAEYIPPFEYENWEMFQQLNGLIHFPKGYTKEITRGSCLYDIKQEIRESNKVGYMITDTMNGLRTKILSSAYYLSKKLHPLYPIAVYKTLCLNKINKTGLYKACFKYEKPHITLTNNLFQNFTDYLHTYYLENYVYKRRLYMPLKASMLLERIHKDLYISKLRKTQITKVTRRDIEEYLCRMDPIVLYNFMAE